MSDVDRGLSSLLAKYVNSEGKVDYPSLEKEEATVGDYVKWLKSFDPENLRTINEKLAFWINAYNMLTIYGVLNKIRRDPEFAKKGNRSIFQRFNFFWWTKYSIGGRKYSLYRIEGILRKKFSEPRIHFALNCGSQSCPLLKDGLYSGENLGQELDIATALFIRSPQGAHIDKENKILHLSSIFKWYKTDFEKASGSIINFVKKYLTDEDRKFIEDNLSQIRISYQEYNWGLNISDS